jgi:hypothetical protein
MRSGKRTQSGQEVTVTLGLGLAEGF